MVLSVLTCNVNKISYVYEDQYLNVYFINVMLLVIYHDNSPKIIHNLLTLTSRPTQRFNNLGGLIYTRLKY